MADQAREGTGFHSATIPIGSALRKRHLKPGWPQHVASRPPSGRSEQQVELQPGAASERAELAELTAGVPGPPASRFQRRASVPVQYLYGPFSLVIYRVQS